MKCPTCGDYIYGPGLPKRCGMCGAWLGGDGPAIITRDSQRGDGSSLIPEQTGPANAEPGHSTDPPRSEMAGGSTKGA